MYFLIMAAHDPITNEEFSSALSLSLSLSLSLLVTSSYCWKEYKRKHTKEILQLSISTPVTAERAGGFGLLPTRRWVTQ